MPTFETVFFWNFASYLSPLSPGISFSPPPENDDLPTFAVSLPVEATVSVTGRESRLRMYWGSWSSNIRVWPLNVPVRPSGTAPTTTVMVETLLASFFPTFFAAVIVTV